MMHQIQIEDLRDELYQIKKQSLEQKSENQFLKVKVRKLTEELTKKNKQLDTLLDPKKNNGISKALSGHGATLIMTLKEKNFILLRKLAEKDLLLKKLQSDLETTRLYLNEKAKPLKLYDTQELSEKDDDLSSQCYCKTSTTRSTVKPRSRSVNPQKKPRSTSPAPASKEFLLDADLQMNYAALLNSNLQKIKQCGSMVQSDKSVPSSNSITPSQNDTPHEEIQQLQSYLLNVLSEVDCLKNTIFELQKEQTRTSLVLSDKNSDINKLVTEVASLNKQTIISGKPGRERPESATTEPMSTDIQSSEYESDYNETTECSIAQAKLPKKKGKRVRMKVIPSKSVSIQTARSFCTRTFTVGDSKQSATEEFREVDTDECDIEVEYIQ